MASLWPWLAVAGAGALHGLNPATGWLAAAVWGVRSRDRAQALRALLPIGVGHVASVALVACAVALGVSLDRALLRVAAGGLLIVAVSVHLLRRRATPRSPSPAGHAALALGSFMTTTAHGAGLMLVPALLPLCGAGAAAAGISAGGAVTLAIAAIVVHAAAMLATTGIVSFVSCLTISRFGAVCASRTRRASSTDAARE